MQPLSRGRSSVTKRASAHALSMGSIRSKMVDQAGRRGRLVELPREGFRVGSRFIVASEAECLFVVVFSKRGNVALYLPSLEQLRT